MIPQRLAWTTVFVLAVAVMPERGHGQRPGTSISPDADTSDSALTSPADDSLDHSLAGSICAIDLPANCQTFTQRDSFAYLSDRCLRDGCFSTRQDIPRRSRVADDFVAAESGDITTVCVKGMYRDQASGLTEDCGDDRTPEKFVIVIYEDSNGLPGTPVIAEQIGTVVSGAIEELDNDGSELWRYQFSLPTPIPVIDGRTYWLEVSANTDGLNDQGLSEGDAFCDWFWLHSDTDNPSEGNGYAFQNNGDLWDFQDILVLGAGTLADDMAWCIDIANEVPPVPLRACCSCTDGALPATCTVTTLDTCINALQGEWIPDQLDCEGGFTCPTAPPPNDECVDAILLDTNEILEWDNRCASHSPAPLDEVDCGGVLPLPFDNDIWFHWVAPETADYTFTTCFDDPFGYLDTIMTIYDNGTGTCPCPTDNSLQRACNDDGCGVFAGFSSLVHVAEAGVCYTIRIGGLAGTQGQGSLQVTPSVTIDCFWPDPVVGDTDSTGNRYLTFEVPPPGDPFCPDAAIRVTLTSIPEFAIPGDGVLWVGEPYDAPDEDTSDPGKTFRVAPLVCEPVFRDWSDSPALSVYGGDVVPGSEYTVDQVYSDCPDLQNPGCYSAPATIPTAKYGDVAAPFDGGITPQPDFVDIAAVVNKFLAVPGAPVKRVAQLQPQTVFPDRAIDFRDIAADVNAFLGIPFSSEVFGTGPCGCPPLVTCGATACFTDSQCGVVGLCIDGFCADACGRCSP